MDTGKSSSIFRPWDLSAAVAAAAVAVASAPPQSSTSLAKDESSSPLSIMDNLLSQVPSSLSSSSSASSSASSNFSSSSPIKVRPMDVESTHRNPLIASLRPPVVAATTVPTGGNFFHQSPTGGDLKLYNQFQAAANFQHQSNLIDTIYKQSIPVLASSEMSFFDNSMLKETWSKFQTQDAFGQLQNQAKKQRPKRFQCPHCQVSFSNNGQLKGHIRIHTGERPFACDHGNCGKTFTRNEELTRHKRIHTGLRPFPCSVCGKRFGRKDHLKKHVKTHQRPPTMPLPMALGAASLPYPLLNPYNPWFPSI